MAMRLPLVINGVDFSEAASRREYQIVYEERSGDAGGMMLNGDMTLDIRAKRPVITWPLNAMWLDELTALYAAINAADYVTVSYLDTVTGQQSEGLFHGTISDQKVGLISTRGTMFHGPTLTLRSK